MAPDWKTAGGATILGSMNSTENPSPQEPKSFAVESVDDWERVLDLVHDFHDGVVRDAWFQEESYVEPSRKLNYGRGRGARLRLLLQFQGQATPAVELSFAGVRRFLVSTDADVDPGEATFADDGATFDFLSCHVEARSCVCRPLDDSYLGSARFFAPARPHDTGDDIAP